jgi:uncharacterized protein
MTRHLATTPLRAIHARKPRAESRTDSGDERRRRILAWMQSHRLPVQGSELAKRFHVSRQCVVQDIAILRANGKEVLATPRGYQLPGTATRSVQAILACRHTPERTEEELQILVDHGVKILDVTVEHPLYGELRGSLMIESRAEVQDFLRRVRATRAMLLSSLTGGVHLHTVEASREEMITRAKAQLRARGFLLR